MIITILVNLVSNNRYLMEPLGEKPIEHLFREANGCRDHLANLAGKNEEGLGCFSILVHLVCLISCRHLKLLLLTYLF